jgi:hypothetical protein
LCYVGHYLLLERIYIDAFFVGLDDLVTIALIEASEMWL